MNLTSDKPLYKPVVDAISRALTLTDFVVSGCAPTIPASGLQVDVASGVIVSNKKRFVYAGGNVTLDAADGTNPRRDNVYLSTAGVLTKQTGTAAASAVPPVLPANVVLVCVVEVAANQTVLASSDMIDGRQQIGVGGGLYNAPLSYERDITGANATEGGAHFKASKSADANSTGAFYGLAGEVAITGGSINHMAGVYGVFHGTGTLFAVVFGVQGKVWAATAGQYVVGTVGHAFLDNATSNSGTTVQGGEFIASLEQGSRTGATAYGFTAKATGTGWGAAYHAIFGDAANNYAVIVQGLSSLSGNVGGAQAKMFVNDLGSTLGGQFVIDLQDATGGSARMKAGMEIRLANTDVVGVFKITNGASRVLFQVANLPAFTFGNTTDGASVDLPTMVAPGSPAAGFKRYYADTADGLYKAKDSAGDVSIMENLVPSRLMSDFDDFIIGSTEGATQAQEEAGTNAVATVTPSVQHFHPSSAKFWVRWTANSTTILASYNMTSIADTNVGDADGTIATDFSSANWAGFVTTEDASIAGWDADSIESSGFNAKAAGTFGVLCGNIIDGGTAVAGLVDPAQWNVVGFGDI